MSKPRKRKVSLKAMQAFRKGTLKSSTSGKKVTDRKQAVAIALRQGLRKGASKTIEGPVKPTLDTEMMSDIAELKNSKPRSSLAPDVAAGIEGKLKGPMRDALKAAAEKKKKKSKRISSIK